LRFPDDFRRMIVPPGMRGRMSARYFIMIVALLAGCAPPQPNRFGVRPGDILRAEPFPGAPDGATATRLLYASTAPDGSAIDVSGLVIVPVSPAPPGGRPILAWLHPTTGVATRCAPSLGPQPFGQIQGLSTFLAAGYVVVATDYPGLGGPGVHPYLVGASEAQAALDSVRAVQHLPETQKRFAVWGHSQGGHAALFTAALAPRYAPELQLVGAAAAAPVTNVAALLEQPNRDPLWGSLLSYTVWSWSRVFGLDPNAIVSPATGPAIETTAAICLESGPELKQLMVDSAPLLGQPVAAPGRWDRLLAENAPHASDIRVPVFLAQGDADPVIVAALTHDFARRLCRGRTPVRYLAMPGVDHYTAAVHSAGAAAAWIAGRFAGIAPPDDCSVID
jgi:pimeloyl-ACP methyl ester carboxylesterase